MKRQIYYGVFTETKEAVEVQFPDVEGCLTFGSDFEEAFEMSVDVLAACLATNDPQFINKPSKYKQLAKKFNKKNQTLVPVPVDEKIMVTYEPRKRFNVYFPASLLKKADEYRSKLNIKRSKLLQIAVEEYMQNTRPDQEHTL